MYKETEIERRMPIRVSELSKRIKPGHSFENKFEKFLSLEVPEDFCINHISKARCSRYGRSNIQEYVDRYHLRTYAGGYQYCASAALQPLMYGWFPFGYLPFCPKLEAIL